MSHDLRRLIDLVEMPIQSFDQLGDWSQQQPHPGASYRKGEHTWSRHDRTVLDSPKVVRKIKAAWSATPFHFDQFFANVPVSYSLIQHGEVAAADLERLVGTEVAEQVLSRRSAEGITVIHTNNLSDREPLPVTAWMLAHRTAHALDGVNGYAGGMGRVRRAFCGILWAYDRYFYGPSETNSLQTYLASLGDHAQEPNGCFTKIVSEVLTMKSATQGRLVGTYEAVFETVAQFIVTGSVKLKPFGDVVEGRRNLDPVACAASLKKVEARLNSAIRSLLEASQGHIFVM